MRNRSRTSIKDYKVAAHTFNCNEVMNADIKTSAPRSWKMFDSHESSSLPLAIHIETK